MDFEFPDPFLAGFDVLKIPVIENGKPVWEEKFPLEKIEKFRRTAGSSRFSSQMMLAPVDMSRGRFDISRLKFYGGELATIESNRLLSFFIGERKVESVSCWWDPAYGAKDGDGSVIAAVFIGADGQYYLHDVEYMLHSDTESEAAASADEQCAQVAEFVRRNHIPAMYVESNGIGKFLPEFLRAMFKRDGIAAGVIEKSSRIAKSLRILDAFDAVVSAGFLNVSERVKATPWVAEFSEWRPDGKGHDDGLDAAAGAILSQPLRLPASAYAPKYRRGALAGKTFKIKSIFDI